jgi:Zn-dependent peptidase ImmA (M78 family)
MPKVNPQNLRWARETAGLSLVEAARVVGLSGKSAPDRLAQMESGEREPTRAQLSKMAIGYRRPLLALYLDTPPRKGQRNRDLRRLPTPDETKEAALTALIRDAYVRHALLQNALEDEDEAEPLPFVGSMGAGATAPEIIAAIKSVLNFEIADYRRAESIDAAFGILREAVEHLGAYVLLIGNLGSHHSALKPAVFRGFSIATPVAPFIVINDGDSKAAWSFTLIHELAHVFLGQSDISGYGSDNATERLCDDVAAGFLIQPGEIEQIKVDSGTSFESLVDQIGTFAHRYKVSRLMVAYNLWRAHVITKSSYLDLDRRLETDRIEAAKRDKKESAVNYYVVRRHRLGRGLISTVGRMMEAGALTAPKAAKVLGVKPASVGRVTSGIAA